MPSLYRNSVRFFAFFLVLLVTVAATKAAEPPAEPPADWGPISSTMEEVPYPYPVHYHNVRNFGLDLKLAYMDVAPTGEANGRTAMIFHGMNFAGAGYEPFLKTLAAAGFRVIIADRIGYGRSSKPDMPYNLHVFTANAKSLLDALGIEQVAIIGHSMGGMVVSRFAMTYPDITSHVVMVNQIGMSDQRQSRPWTDLESAYERVRDNTTYDSIVRNHRVYYPEWKPEYLYWVKLQYGQTLTSEWPRLAKIRAWQQQILFFDPVVYDWQHIATKALVIGGADDRLTPDYAGSARKVAHSLQNAELVLLDGVGHNPHLQAPERFFPELIRFLRSDPAAPANTAWKKG